ncbi:MAG TPA: glycosyltransferase family 39 protein [Polyangia bacterium]|nr:glycosyltransferase family 39 protein [Polyangia bacterium]
MSTAPDTAPPGTEPSAGQPQAPNVSRGFDRRLLLGLALFVAVLYVPFAGNYGLWDPWETHYSEVARQMRMRGDYVSLWWPGSPQDRNEFWSKPVLTFWLIAAGMTAARLETSGGPALPGSGLPGTSDGELASGWAMEWAARLPFLLCAIVCLWAVWELVRRLAGRRPAAWSVIVLATSSQFAFVARQAMTDMAFVAPMAVALCFAGLGLLLPAEEVEAELPRRERRVGRWRVSWPHARIYYVLLGLVVLTVVPQLLLISIQVQMELFLGNFKLRTIGLVPMLPWIGALVAYLVASTRARCRRQLYFHLAFLMCGLATLAKGPAGVGLPVIVVFIYLLAQGEIRRLWPGMPAGAAPWKSPRGIWQRVWRAVAHNPLEVGLGLVLFIAVAFPWYHAMLIRHGMGFWNEFIGDNYVRRAAGRHGDRGTFEYYILQVGHGMYPWIGVVAPAFFLSLRRLAGTDGRARLRGYALAWFLVMFAVMTLVNTKFHHYILPALPALAILAGLMLDELVTRPTVVDALGVLLVGLPFLGLVGRDLALFPQRLSWLFDYDYVNAPNGGRAWPTAPEYDYTARITAFSVAAALATLWLGAVALVRARAGARIGEEEAGHGRVGTEALTGPDVEPRLPRWGWYALGLVPLVTLLIAEWWQPAVSEGPHPLDNGWILVGVATALVLLVLVGRGLGPRAWRAPTLGLLFLGGFACLWTSWAIDRHLTDLSPHWSQKHVIATYYRLRKGPDEPLIAWQMYWRGETFYSKNVIYDHRLPQAEKTVFLGDRNTEKLQAYFKEHAGRRVFFIIERSRFESLRALLPEAARPTLQTVDQTNNKVYLAVATI